MLYKQLALFPGMESERREQKNKNKQRGGIFTPNNRFGLSLCERVNFTSVYQMPIVKKCTIDVPKDIYCYYRMGNRRIMDVIPHFYTSDEKLLPFLCDPFRHLKKIRIHKVVIGIDLSIKPEMPIPMKTAISFYNKLIMAWWQYIGMTVIPNVVVDKSIIDVCLDGYPKRSIIAMNSSGIGTDKRSKQNWQIIYPHVVETLEPIKILRYGGKQPNEIEKISIYYENDNKKFKNYGR